MSSKERSLWGWSVAVIILTLAACSPEGPVRAAITVAPSTTGDVTDPFCEAWTTYDDTVRVLGANDGLADAAVSRLEVIGSAALVEAVEGIGSNWPQELLGERSVVLTDLVGPPYRRALRALEALADVGATELDVAQLRRLWSDAIASDGPFDLGPMPSDLADLAAAAVQPFDAANTPYRRDPTLMPRSLVTPLTTQYVTTTCGMSVEL